MRVGNKESLKQTQQKVRRVLASPCDRPPASPTGVAMRFVAVEAKTHLNFRGKIVWDDVTEDTSGIPINTVDRWDIQWRATDVDGNPVEPSDAVDQAMLRLATNPGDGTYFRFTTREPHGFSPGMMVTVKKCFPQTDYNGTYSIFDVPAPSVFRVLAPTSPVADCRDPGEVFHDNPKRIHRTHRRDPVARAVLTHATDVGSRDEIQRVHLSSFGGQNEIQEVSLSGFGGSDRFHLTWGGKESNPLTHGTHYDADKIKYAIEHIPGFKGQVGVTAVSPSGFTVEFRGAYREKNVSPLSVTHPRGCSGTVSTTQQGSGPAASFKLEWPADSGNKSGLIERGTNYSPAHVKNRIQGIPGFLGEVEINNLSDSGFTIHYVGYYARTPMDDVGGKIKVVDEFGCTGSVTTEQVGDYGGNIYRYTTRGPHGFIVGQHVHIKGCSPVYYNGHFTLTSVGPNTFEVHGPFGGVIDATELGFAYDEDDSLHVPIPNVPRPRTWYWVARVRARSGEGCWSAWSDWTDPELPWTGADPRPPAPTFTDPGCITFDRVMQHRDYKLRLLFTFDEVQDWDVPGGDHEPDVAAYVVQLDHSDDGIVWEGRPYVTHHLPAKDVDSTDDDDTPATRTAIFHRIRRDKYYRCRARTVDRFGRRGDWSEWTSAAVPFDNDAPPTPLNVTVFDRSTDRVVVQWDSPTELVATRGTVSGTSGTPDVVGTGTKFTVEVREGSAVRIVSNDYVVKSVTDDTNLVLTTNLSGSPAAASLQLIADDPDVAAYVVQLGVRAKVTRGSPDVWDEVYKEDQTRGNQKSFRVDPGDTAKKFLARVRSVDGALNKSRWIDATLTGNSDPDVGGDAVFLGLSAGISTIVRFTARGVLEVKDYNDRWTNTSDKTLRFVRSRMSVSVHDKATHPNDGAPHGSPVKANVQFISAKVGVLEAAIDDTTTTLTVNEIAGHPPPATNFEIQIDDERMNVTTRVAGAPATYTVTRDYDGQGAADHDADANVFCDPDEVKTTFEPLQRALFATPMTVAPNSHRDRRRTDQFLVPVILPEEQLSFKVTDVGGPSDDPGPALNDTGLNLEISVYLAEATGDEVFIPTNVPSLAGWWRADSLTEADAATVATWLDESGGGNDLLQATNVNKPTFHHNIRNGLPALLFDGSNDSMRVASDLGVPDAAGAPATIIVVSKKQTATPGTHQALAGWVDTTDTTGFLVARHSTTDLAQFAIENDSGTTKTANGGSWSDGAWHVLVFTTDGSLANVYIDGRPSGTADQDLAIAGSVTVDAFAVGARDMSTGAQWFNGYIAEVLVFTAQLSETTRGQAEVYAGGKWGIAVS